jgi:hypothetical protein
MKQDEVGNPIVKALVGTEYCTRQINMHEVLELEASADTSTVAEDKFVESIKAIREELKSAPNLSLDAAKNSLREIMHSVKITALPNVTPVQSVVFSCKEYGEQSWSLAVIRAVSTNNELFNSLVDDELLERVSNDQSLLYKLLKMLTLDNIDLKHVGFSTIQILTIEAIVSANLNQYLHGDRLITEKVFTCEIEQVVPIIGRPGIDAIKRRLALIVKILSDYL